jgi:hypothetical protein
LALYIVLDPVPHSQYVPDYGEYSELTKTRASIEGTRRFQAEFQIEGNNK